MNIRAAGLLTGLACLIGGVVYNRANEPDVAMLPSWRSQGTQSSINYLEQMKRGPTVCADYAKLATWQKWIVVENRWCGEWIESYGARYGLKG